MSVSSGKQILFSYLLLSVVTVAVYSSALRHPFTDYDDTIYVTNNLHAQAGLTWKTFTWAWTTTEADNWHPLTWLSHSLDCQLYGLNPAGHHATSILLHLINVLLLFRLLVWATRAIGRSVLVAMLFGLHPVNVESVVWVAERKNVLCTLFFLLALGAYGWYARRPNGKRYLLMAALFALGLAAKPMVITLPFALLFLDIWPLQRIQDWEPSIPPLQSKGREQRKRRSERLAPGNPAFRLGVSQVALSRLVVEKLPLLVLCAGSALITIIAQRTNAMQTLQKFPLNVRLENALYAYAMYVGKALWPVRLAVYYPHPGGALAAWRVALAAIFLAGVSLLVWKYRSRRYLMAGWLWYIVTLVPVIGLVQVGSQAMADRYAYIPLLGIFVMVVWGLADLAEAAAVNLRWQTAFAALALCVLSFLTWRQIGYWRSDYDLWSHTVDVTTENPIAEEKLAIALAQLGRDEEALPGLEKAARLNPSDPTRHANFGKELIAIGRWQDALVEYQKAIQVTSTMTERSADARGIQARCYESLATIYVELGDFSKMRESYTRALKIDPQQAPAMVDRISSYADSDPSGKRYLQLAVLLQELDRLQEARDAYQQALDLDPSLRDAIRSLGIQIADNK